MSSQARRSLFTPGGTRIRSSSSITYRNSPSDSHPVDSSPDVPSATFQFIDKDLLRNAIVEVIKRLCKITLPIWAICWAILAVNRSYTWTCTYPPTRESCDLFDMYCDIPPSSYLLTPAYKAPPDASDTIVPSTVAQVLVMPLTLASFNLKLKEHKSKIMKECSSRLGCLPNVLDDTTTAIKQALPKLEQSVEEACSLMDMLVNLHDSYKESMGSLNGAQPRLAPSWTTVILWPFPEVFNVLGLSFISGESAELFSTTEICQELAYRQTSFLSRTDYYLSKLISQLGDKYLLECTSNLIDRVHRASECSTRQTQEISIDYTRYTSYRPWWKKIVTTFGYKFWDDKAHEHEYSVNVALGKDLTELKSFLNQTEQGIVSLRSGFVSLSAKIERISGQNIYRNRFGSGDSRMRDAYRNFVYYGDGLMDEVDRIPNGWQKQKSIEENRFGEQRGDKQFSWVDGFVGL